MTAEKLIRLVEEAWQVSGVVEGEGDHYHILTALFMSLLALWGITYLALDLDRLITEREGE
jgi:hypothetical protein